jgi:hypothetical protein
MAKTTASAEGAIHRPGLTGSNRSIPDRPLIEFHQVLAPEVVLHPLQDAGPILLGANPAGSAGILPALQGAGQILPTANRELESFTEANEGREENSIRVSKKSSEKPAVCAAPRPVPSKNPQIHQSPAPAPASRRPESR